MRYDQKSRGAFQYGFDDAGTDGKIAKTFIIQTVSRPICHPAFDNFKDFRFGNVFFKQARNAGAVRGCRLRKGCSGRPLCRPNRFPPAWRDRNHSGNRLRAKRCIRLPSHIWRTFRRFYRRMSAGSVRPPPSPAGKSARNAGHRVLTLDGNRFAD